MVVLPVPNKILATNCQIGSLKGRYAKAASTKRHRRLAKEAVEEQEMCGKAWEFSTVETKMFFETNRRRDDDNNLGWLKAYFDGLVDSGLAIDDDSKHMRKHVPEVLVDKEHPRIEMVITRKKSLGPFELTRRREFERAQRGRRAT